MNIICTIDDKYAQHCGVMLCSLFVNNPGVRFRVFIMSDGLTEGSKDKLNRTAHDFGQELIILQVPPGMFQSVCVSGHVSVAGYFRFLIPKVVPEDVDKALFLDSDMIVKGSVAQLYEQSLDGFTHAAVVNPLCGPVHKAIPASLGMPEGSPYFNSGVLLLNLQIWREEQISDRVVEYFQANAPRLRFWHHDALNATLHGRGRACHPMWNVQRTFLLARSGADLGVSDEDLFQVKTAPRIVHFTGTSKPWGYYDSHPLRTDYFQYLRQTPWRGYRPYDRPSAPVRARSMVSRLAPEFVKSAYRKLGNRSVPAEK